MFLNNVIIAALYILDYYIFVQLYAFCMKLAANKSIPRILLILYNICTLHLRHTLQILRLITIFKPLTNHSSILSSFLQT